MKTAEQKKPLKIAFFVNEFPCISETFVLDQITGLLELGHDVRIFAYRPDGRPKQHAAITEFGLLKRTKYFGHIPEDRWQRLRKLIRISFQYFPRRPLRIGRCLDFKKYGVYEAVNHLFFLEPLINEDFDVIHCQYGTLGKRWVHLKDIVNVKLVTSFRGYDLEKFVKENHPAVYEELFRKGDIFLPVCDYFARRLQELGCPKDRIQVHFSGVDIKKFPFRERPMDDKEIRFFTIARLVEKKGLEYSIRAVAQLVPQYPEIRYTIAGAGPLRPQLENLIRDLKMENHIYLTGPLPSEEIQELLNKAHVFILASVTARDGDQEGIPVSLYEAMATGLPVVSTRHSGIPELVEDGISGFLVPERDVEGLVSKCEYLISHPQRCTEMGRAGRKFVEEHCDSEKLNRKLAERYRSARSSVSEYSREAKNEHRVAC